MPGRSRDFGPVVRLEAEARGVPGNRTFRLLIANEFEQAILHVEKEQLQALGLALDQILARIRAPGGAGSVPSGPPGNEEIVEFRIGRLGLGFDESADRFVIVAYSEDTAEGAPADFVCQANRLMVEALGKQIDDIVASGRPRCPLCGAPINPDGHVCVRSNGHFTVQS